MKSRSTSTLLRRRGCPRHEPARFYVTGQVLQVDGGSSEDFWHRDAMIQTNRTYTIAVIPGDGIGKEVVPEGLRALETAAGRFGFALRFKHRDFASCDFL